MSQVAYACSSLTPKSINLLHPHKVGILNAHITFKNAPKDLTKMLLVT